MFKKVLIANRGEIAVRVIKTCKELGIKTVAIYSDADEHSLHRLLADESIPIGGNLASESYLDMDKIISAVNESKADAIHPGYGFLSENSTFSERCRSTGITFIGPTPEVMHKMGDKLNARETAMKVGVPVVPGTAGTKTAGEAVSFARQIGFPVLIKASGGGGGKGIRFAENEKQLSELFNTAKEEAKRLFKNDEVYIEKFIIEPRHVEIQILADSYGNAFHLANAIARFKEDIKNSLKNLLHLL